jgi:hypothetical protein
MRSFGHLNDTSLGKWLVVGGVVPMKRCLQSLAICAVLSGFGCSLDPIDTSVAIKLPTKKAAVLDVPEPAAKPWTPPANQLPRDFVQAVQFLHAHGLPDPRGGTFSKVQFPAGQSRDGSLEYYGWIFKDSGGGKRFVGMDGLSRHDFAYPMPADIDAFATDPDNARTPQHTALMPGGSGSVMTMGDDGFNPGMLDHCVAAALFLVDGRADIATKLCSPGPIVGPRAGAGQPVFLRMADGVLGSKLYLAVDAYSRGDDQSALNLARDLVALRPIYEKEALAVLRSDGQARLRSEGPGIGLHRFGGTSWTEMTAGSRVYLQGQVVHGTDSIDVGAPKATPASAASAGAFDFLDSAPVLLAETQRRLAEPQIDKKIPDRESANQTAARLVRQLEDVGNMGYGPGSPLVQSNVVQLESIQKQLGTIQTPAVNALIECMRHDKRLSRQVWPTDQGYSFASTSSLAFQLFVNLTNAPIAQEFHGQQPPLAKVESWWAQNKSLNASERAYRVLADDKAGDDAWVEAALLICPARAEWSPGMHLEELNQPKSLEDLRGHAAPSVSALMARRILELVQPAPRASRLNPGYGGLQIPPGTQQAQQICESLWAWDPKASLKPIQVVSDLLYKQNQEQRRFGGNGGQSIDNSLFALFQDRVELNDPSVVARYKQMIAEEANGGDVFPEQPLVFFYKHQHDPRFSGLAKAMFLDPVLHPQPQPEGTPAQTFSRALTQFNGPGPFALQIANSPLLGIPEEREAVFHLLSDKTPIGKVVDDGKTVSGRTLGGQQFIAWGSVDDALAPAPGKSFVLRECDYAMVKLLSRGKLQGAPNFQPYWPPDVKDQAIKKTIDLIETHKNDVIALLQWPNTWQDPPGYKPNQTSVVRGGVRVGTATSPNLPGVGR